VFAGAEFVVAANEVKWHELVFTLIRHVRVIELEPQSTLLMSAIGPPSIFHYQW
jgi:hypothetical protein